MHLHQIAEKVFFFFRQEWQKSVQNHSQEVKFRATERVANLPKMQN